MGRFAFIARFHWPRLFLVGITIFDWHVLVSPSTTMSSFRWLPLLGVFFGEYVIRDASLYMNIKRNMRSMFVNKKHRYCNIPSSQLCEMQDTQMTSIMLNKNSKNKCAANALLKFWSNCRTQVHHQRIPSEGLWASCLYTTLLD